MAVGGTIAVLAIRLRDTFKYGFKRVYGVFSRILRDFRRRCFIRGIHCARVVEEDVGEIKTSIKYYLKIKIQFKFPNFQNPESQYN